MGTDEIKAGAVIENSRWPEPVELDLVQEKGEYIRIVGSTVVSGDHVDSLLSQDEFQDLIVKVVKTDFNADASDFFLSLETKRYRHASLYDPLLAVNTSNVDPLPHQIEAVYGYVLKLPRIRFLIADDPGAGKTILAGLIIKELKLRYQVERILIVVPGHLKDQWRREMSDRFRENFVVVDRDLIRAVYGENVWTRENQIITSMDFAKQDDILSTLSGAHFDLIIVDEAHKMSAYRYGDKVKKTQRYQLGEILSQKTDHLLFLTATPHKGDPDNFKLFLDLLEPGFFATNEMIHESIKSKDNPLFIRRIKEDLEDFEGKPLFLPRHVKTLTYDLGVESPEEKNLYNELSEYVNTQYNKALTKEKSRNIAFALIILQRRIASSTYALYESLKRRKERLERLLAGVEQQEELDEKHFDFESIEDMSEEERWKEEEIWETLSVAENRRELRREIETLNRLIRDSERIINKGDELKLRQLKKTVDDLEDRFPDEKILIFTEARDTLDYLEKRIKSWGYSVNTIHGGMSLEDRVKAEDVFENETQVLVATEAAGEGINLQFCHLMINYDLPWNPNRLEQRMGRIHRYGQTKEVFIFNLVAKDTREGRVMNRLFEKLEEIRKALGSDKVYDVLSAPLYGRNLSKMLMEAVANARRADEILEEIDVQVDEEYIKRVKEQMGDTLATRFIDYTQIKEMREEAREHRLIPEYTEAFFKKAYKKVEGRIRSRGEGVFEIENLPSPIRRVTESEGFKQEHGQPQRRYSKVSFDKSIASKDNDTEFLSFGHPLFEGVMAWIEKSLYQSLQRGATFMDPDGEMDGVILFYEGEIMDGRGRIAGRRLFPFFIGKDLQESYPVDSATLWDLKEGGEANYPVGLDSYKDIASNTLVTKLNEYQNDLVEERKHQAAVKEKYGIKSLEHLILELDKDLIDLYTRRDQGEDVRLPIYNKEERKKRYENALEDLKRTIEQEKSLTISSPRFVGAARVIPSAVTSPSMRRDPDIEQVGMKATMEYERRMGRRPKDVSSDNVGYDVKSQSPDGEIRYIEVKARARSGAVALTKNEWFTAQRLKEDFYLYVVLNATKAPVLRIVRNPAAELEPDERLEVVRYIVSADQIESKGELDDD